MNKVTQESVAAAYQPLFDLLSKEHGLTLLKGEMDDIISAVDKVSDTLNELYRNVCDVKGCNETATAGGMCWRDKGYWSTCSRHNDLYRNNEPMPPMKSLAVEREENRPAKGIIRS